MTKSRILLVIPNLGPGGAQKVFHQHFDLLSHQYDVHGCVFNWDGAFPEDKTRNIISLNVPAGRNLIQKIRGFLLRIGRLKKLKKELSISLTLSHLEGADYVNVLSSVKDKTILWIHGTKKFDREIKGLIGMLRKKLLIPILYSRADRLVCVSRGIQSELRSLIPGSHNKIYVTYNGIDLEFIRGQAVIPADQNLISLCTENKVIITHARLAAQKNLDFLIEVIATFRERTNVKWIIIGDGDQRDHLLAQCKQLGLDYYSPWESGVWSSSCQLFFLGHQQNPFSVLNIASAYVMTSLWEGFPLALLEALACGIPVIAADCPTGPRELLAPECKDEQLKHPYPGPFGFLMPALDSNDNKKAVALWTHTFNDFLDNHNYNRPDPAIIAEALLDFSIESAALSLNTHVSEVLK